jgi:hypothetical protein
MYDTQRRCSTRIVWRDSVGVGRLVLRLLDRIAKMSKLNFATGKETSRRTALYEIKATPAGRKREVFGDS